MPSATYRCRPTSSATIGPKTASAIKPSTPANAEVAAPTAGLHFSDRVLAALSIRGIERAEIVLHVGPGTFQPVKVDDVEDHRVAAEPFEIPVETAEAVARVKARGSRVVAVGTTSVRALETASLDDGRVRPGHGQTDLVISPPFSFQVTDALVTNFHLPRSSLLLLVSAFAGRERILGAYAEAVPGLPVLQLWRRDAHRFKAVDGIKRRRRLIPNEVERVRWRTERHGGMRRGRSAPSANNPSPVWRRQFPSPPSRLRPEYGAFCTIIPVATWARTSRAPRVDHARVWDRTFAEA